MNSSLKDKKILFIGPVFYEYTNYILIELERLGARVFFVNEQPFSSFDPIYSVLGKISPPGLAAYCNLFLLQRLNALKQETVDIVFVLRGETITPGILFVLRQRYPRARFVYYNWDSVAVKPNALRIWENFDIAFSFDRNDCELYPQFTYQPTFFLPLFEPENDVVQDIDVSFIGNSHSDRLPVLRCIAEQLQRAGVRFDARILVSRWKPKPTNNPNDILSPFYITKAVSLETVKVLTMRSTAIIDIHHQGQTGLTQRTFEALNMGLKLFTTNERISEEPFYDARQIQILDRKNPHIDLHFLHSPSVRLNLQAYRLEAWLSAILSFS